MKSTFTQTTVAGILRIAAVCMLILFVFALDGWAQGTPPLPLFPNEPAPAPIDGGLGLLAAAGGAYAWRKLRAREKR
jgi:hypothetical protein